MDKVAVVSFGREYGELVPFLRSLARPTASSPARSQTPAEARIDISRLPVTGEEFVGRSDYLDLLERAYRRHFLGGTDERMINVVVLCGWGGIGKSSLINRWISLLAERGWAKETWAFGWSFYQQGASDASAATADAFIDEALRFFGDEEPAAGSVWDRGLRLADLICKRRGLLILDGTEPLQHDEGGEGRFKDQALSALMRSLAARNTGLCVIATRRKVADVAAFGTVLTKELEDLSEDEGAQLLRSLGVHGPDEEVRRASGEVAGHAFTLNLIGTYLRDVCNGDIRRRGEALPQVVGDSRLDRTRRILASYERELGDGPALEMLGLLSLYDRATTPDEVDVVLREPAIRGLTSILVDLADYRWDQTLTRLRRARLMIRADGRSPSNLDIHPLVRAYFAARLREQHPEAWREGNLRIYEHLSSTSPERPTTLGDLSRLCEAVMHGCRAGRQQEAFEAIYKQRICCHALDETGGYYSRNSLGGVASDLAALSGFFDERWSRIYAGFPDADKAYILNASGVDLWNLGRLSDAVRPVSKAVQIARGLPESPSLVARCAGDLSELYQTMGRLAEAIEAARMAVDHADRSDFDFMKEYTRVRLGDVLLQLDELDQSEDAFRSAERITVERLGRPHLESVYGFWYCELLLERIERALASPTLVECDVLALCDEIDRRANHSKEYGVKNLRVLDIGHAHLLLGRTATYRASLLSAGGLSGNLLDEARTHLDRAIVELRRASQEDEMPRGFLARAALRRISGDLEDADRDLDDCLDVATRGSMLRYVADTHIERIRLLLALYERRQRCNDLDGVASIHDMATKCLEEARRLVTDLGYRRRRGVLTYLGAEIEGRRSGSES